MAVNELTRLTTGRARLSYVHLFQPYAHQLGQDPKYSTTILIPKSDIATKQRIDAAVNAAIADGVKTKWNGVKPPIVAIPVYDGDGVRPSDGMPFGTECKGCWVFTASSKNPIPVVDVSVQPILNQTEIYSGVYARVNVQFFPYNSNGKKGIGVGLGAVQKVEDGEPLAGGISAEQAFGEAVGSYTRSTPIVQAYVPPVVQATYTQPMSQHPPVALDPITGQPVDGVLGI